MSDERGAGETLVAELEATVADVGALVARLARYRLGTDAAGGALAREALRLGDAARAHHRRGTLDADAARALLADANALRRRIEARLAAVRAAPEYAAAVTAFAADDRPALVRLLPTVFAHLETVVRPEAFYYPLDWRRRGRPRPVAELVADVVRARDAGLTPEGDDLSRGADASLPAVVLADAPPSDEPVVLVIDAGACGPTVLRLVDSGEYLVHTPALRALAGVHVAEALPADEIEASPLDWGRYRVELVAALEAAGVGVTPAPAGAA